MFFSTNAFTTSSKSDKLATKYREINNSNEQCKSIKDGYYRLQENDEMKELNKLLGIDWKNGIVKLEELNNYGKHSYTTEKIGKKEV